MTFYYANPDIKRQALIDFLYNIVFKARPEMDTEYEPAKDDDFVKILNMVCYMIHTEFNDEIEFHMNADFDEWLQSEFDYWLEDWEAEHGFRRSYEH